MNGETRKKLYVWIAKRDGDYCHCCGRLPIEKQLIIDHRDNDNSNNNLDNLQILCRTCNYVKNPRRPLEEVSESINKEETELQKSNRTEPQFKRFAIQELNQSKRHNVLEQELINAGAEYVGISPVTTKRYLNKLCSSRGILRRIYIGNKIYISY